YHKSQREALVLDTTQQYPKNQPEALMQDTTRQYLQSQREALVLDTTQQYPKSQREALMQDTTQQYLKNQREALVQDKTQHLKSQQAVNQQYLRNLLTNRQSGGVAGMNCGIFEVCCNPELYQGAFSSNFNSYSSRRGACGLQNNAKVNGRINHPRHEEGDAEFGEYPWQAAVLKKEGFDNVYVCAGTLVDHRH
ncbi:hypothetical protein OTU49_006601, partial [Cherax quadricarinatus]